MYLKYIDILSEVLSNNENITAESKIYLDFIRGPFMATFVTSYLLLAFIAYFPFRKKEEWARNAIVTAFGVWFILDTFYCMYYKIYFQAFVLNGLSFIQKAVPLYFTWNDFRKQK
ncbi:MAG: hypothetical protein HC906_00375 [Bacteroidales bacterium]|nr:hypothetical protein [Bacteroidales bacterium]